MSVPTVYIVKARSIRQEGTVWWEGAGSVSCTSRPTRPGKVLHVPSTYPSFPTLPLPPTVRERRGTVNQLAAAFAPCIVWPWLVREGTLRLPLLGTRCVPARNQYVVGWPHQTWHGLAWARAETGERTKVGRRHGQQNRQSQREAVMGEQQQEGQQPGTGKWQLCLVPPHLPSLPCFALLCFPLLAAAT